MVNIGQCIKEELMRQERTVSWLAQKLNCNRPVVYRIMQKNSIDTMMLMRICVILHTNFFHLLAGDAEERLAEFSQNDTLL